MKEGVIHLQPGLGKHFLEGMRMPRVHLRGSTKIREVCQFFQVLVNQRNDQGSAIEIISSF